MASRSLLAALPSSPSVSTGRVGRPAKTGERYPSGKLKPTCTAPTQIRRMIDMARRDAADPVLATAIGWMRLHELVSDVDVAAALAYAKLKGQYDQVIGAPCRSARSPSYQVGIGISRTTDTSEQERHAAAARRRYGAMLSCLDNAKQRELLDRVCVDDEQPSAWEMTDLLAALGHVARHLRMSS